jgi:GT2 family glycosyltransferase
MNMVRLIPLVLNYNAASWTVKLVTSLRKHCHKIGPILIHDNGSKDGDREVLRKELLQHPGVHLTLGETNVGAPAGRNILLSRLQVLVQDTDLIVFLDNDTEVGPAWEEQLFSLYRAIPNLGAVGQHGHRIVVHGETRELLPARSLIHEVDVIPTYCFAVPARVLGDTRFDENLGLFWHEDDDFSLQIRAKGYQNIAVPHLDIVHHEHKSNADKGLRFDPRSYKNQRYLTKKWRECGYVSLHREIVAKPGVEERGESLVLGAVVSGGTSSLAGHFYFAPEVEFSVPIESGATGTICFSGTLMQPWKDLKRLLPVRTHVAIYQHERAIQSYEVGPEGLDFRFEISFEPHRPIGKIKLISSHFIPRAFLTLPCLPECADLVGLMIKGFSATVSINGKSQEVEFTSRSAAPRSGFSSKLPVVSSLSHSLSETYGTLCLTAYLQSHGIEVGISPTSLDQRLLDHPFPWMGSPFLLPTEPNLGREVGAVIECSEDLPGMLSFKAYDQSRNKVASLSLRNGDNDDLFMNLGLAPEAVVSRSPQATNGKLLCILDSYEDLESRNIQQLLIENLQHHPAGFIVWSLRSGREELVYFLTERAPQVLQALQGRAGEVQVGLIEPEILAEIIKGSSTTIFCKKAVDVLSLLRAFSFLPEAVSLVGEAVAPTTVQPEALHHFVRAVLSLSTVIPDSQPSSHTGSNARS